MEEFLIYLLGWLTFVAFFYIAEYAVVKNPKMTKGLVLYRGLKLGIFSWVGVFVLFLIIIVGWVFVLDDKIERKLGRK